MSLFVGLDTDTIENYWKLEDLYFKSTDLLWHKLSFLGGLI